MYRFRLFRKRNLFINGGYDYTTRYFNHQVIDPEFNRHLDDIKIKSDHSTIKIGLNQQLLFYDGSVLLNFSVLLSHSIPHQSQTNFTLPSTQNDNSDWIRYSYDYNLFEGEFFENDANLSSNKFHRLNSELSTEVLFKLLKGYLNFGVSYSRNHYRFYDYNAKFEYFENNNPIPYQVSTITASGAKSLIRDHFIGLNLGYTYFF